MAYTAPPDKSTGDTFSETNWDTHIRANILYFKARMDALDYAQITTGATISGASEGAADTVISGASIAYDNTRKRIEFFSPKITVPAAATPLTIVLLRGATVLGQAKFTFQGDGASTESTAAKIEVYDAAPSAGTYAYVVKAFVAASSGTVDAGAGISGALLPAFLRITSDA